MRVLKTDLILSYNLPKFVKGIYLIPWWSMVHFTMQSWLFWLPYRVKQIHFKYMDWDAQGGFILYILITRLCGNTSLCNNISNTCKWNMPCVNRINDTQIWLWKHCLQRFNYIGVVDMPKSAVFCLHFLRHVLWPWTFFLRQVATTSVLCWPQEKHQTKENDKTN